MKPCFKQFLYRLLTVMIVWGAEISTRAETNEANHNRILVIGTQVVPPFGMKREDGTWEGISIDLWRRIAERLHLKYEFRELPFNAMIDAVASNQVDVAVGALTVTAERQKRVDFTHSFYNSGLAIAVRRQSDEHHMWDTLSGLFTVNLFEIVMTILIVLVLSGTSVWFFERKANRGEFGGLWWRGLGSGLWWSAAALTTTGYGDKTPRTFGGRAMAVFWMFAGLIIISSFTAAVTASLTVKHFTQSIRSFGDLTHHRVAVITGTTSDTYLQKRRIAVVRFPSGEPAMQALNDGKVDAFVNDTPLLLYRANQMQDSVMVLPQTFDPQGYGLALTSGSPLFKEIDIALLETIADPAWQQILDKYLNNP